MGVPVSGPVGGGRAPNGIIIANGPYEHVLRDLRSRLRESTEIRTHATQRTVARNYGNLDLEMAAEQDVEVKTPHNAAPDFNLATTTDIYRLRAGTPLFVERMRADAKRLVARVADDPLDSTTVIQLSAAPATFGLDAGAIVEINEEQRTVTAIGATSMTLGAPLSLPPGAGAEILVKGWDVHNPHQTPVYRITDKYNSGMVDDNRFQVDHDSGVIRYRPRVGTLNGNSIWHPDNQTNKTYYFGRMINITTSPLPAVTQPDSVQAGSTATTINTSVNPTIYGITAGVTEVVIQGQRRLVTATGATSFNVAALAPVPPVGATIHVLPPGFSDLRVTAPAGMAVQVEINGAIVGAASNGGNIDIPFWDNNPNNDALKLTDNIDPDAYIARYLKSGANTIAIKATTTNANTGIQVTTSTGAIPLFNNVDISTTSSDTSSNPMDWSTSQFSVLGIAGQIDFELGDRIALENTVDSVSSYIGVLESLSALISDTDVNHLQSLLSLVR